MSQKKYFTLNKMSERFRGFDEGGRILIEEGFNLASKYVLDKANRDNKKNFIEALESQFSDVDKSRSEKYAEKLVKYAMQKAGIDVSNFSIDMVKNPNINKNVVFAQNFNAILAQVITPIVPAMVSTEFMDMADVSNIGWGETARFKVKSNDFFVVTKAAEGILTGAVQRVYNDEITINPIPYNITTAVDWYQVASGVFDIGDFVYKVGVSFSSYVSMTVIAAMKDYIANNLSAAYKTNGFTPAKFAEIAERVSAANGGSAVRAYGPLTAVMNILPGLGSSTSIANLQADIGKEWTSLGYLGRYGGIDLVKIPQIILPNTVNTDALLGVPSDTIYFMPDGGYSPVKIVFEGTTVAVDIIPTESPDKEMGMSVTMRMGSGFVNASKFGAMTGITGV